MQYGYWGERGAASSIWWRGRAGNAVPLWQDEGALVHLWWAHGGGQWQRGLPGPAELRTTSLSPSLSPLPLPPIVHLQKQRLQREVRGDLHGGSRGAPASAAAACVCADVGLVPQIWQRRHIYPSGVCLGLGPPLHGPNLTLIGTQVVCKWKGVCFCSPDPPPSKHIAGLSSPPPGSPGLWAATGIRDQAVWVPGG